MASRYDLPCKICGSRVLDFRVTEVRHETWDKQGIEVVWEIGEYVCPACGATERHARVAEIGGLVRGPEKSD